MGRRVDNKTKILIVGNPMRADLWDDLLYAKYLDKKEAVMSDENKSGSEVTLPRKVMYHVAVGVDRIANVVDAGVEPGTLNIDIIAEQGDQKYFGHVWGKVPRKNVPLNNAPGGYSEIKVAEKDEPTGPGAPEEGKSGGPDGQDEGAPQSEALAEGVDEKKTSVAKGKTKKAGKSKKKWIH